MDDSSVLSRTYHHSTALGIKGYLRRTFPGRAILTRLRIDDLDLGAAGYRGKSMNKELCSMCGEDAETREHFVLRCRPLSAARDANRKAMDLNLRPPQAPAFDVLILATPRGAEDDISTAITVGKLFHDLWTLRAKLLGLRNTMD